MNLSTLIRYGKNFAQIIDERIALSNKISSNSTGVAGADAITNIISLTQAEYDAIPVKNPTTFYIITN